MEAQDNDIFQRINKLQEEFDFLETQEKFIKSEHASLEHELKMAQEEIRRVQAVPLIVGQFVEMVDEDHAIVSVGNGGNSLVRVLSTINREKLKPLCSVGLHRVSNALVRILPPENDTSTQIVTEKPDVSYSDIGGMDQQKQELREAVELPLTHGYLYEQIGIQPPRGVLLYGPPGTGKTMLAKAVAHHTDCTFIAINGSEFVQKYLGEGPRMVRDIFRLARENQPAIIFIDEVDSIATKRYETSGEGDREVQRILMELLTQMDGFSSTSSSASDSENANVKIIMATNRADTLDPALLRPGRLDRKVEFFLPDRRQKRLIFQVCTAKMNLDQDVDLEILIARPDKLSGAEINSVCMEAGMRAVRENRYIIRQEDFETGYKIVIKKRESSNIDFYE